MQVLQIVHVYPADTSKYAHPIYKQQIDALTLLGVKSDVMVTSGKLNKLSAAISLHRKLRETNYSLIHAYYGYSGLIAITQKKVPVLISFLGSDVYRPIQRLLSMMVSRKVKAAIVMTEKMKKILKLNHAYIIPEGINLEIFRPESQLAARQKLGFNGNERLVLFGGSPRNRAKGFPLAKQTFQIVKRQLQHARLVVLDKINHHQVATYMNACDCLLITSKYEGSPNIVKEAMACNLPIVSVDVGDVRETIKDTTGCYICQHSAYELSEGMAMVLRNPIRTNGRGKIKHLELGRVTERIVGVYEEVINQTRTGRQ